MYEQAGMCGALGCYWNLVDGLDSNFYLIAISYTGLYLTLCGYKTELTRTVITYLKHATVISLFCENHVFGDLEASCDVSVPPSHHSGYMGVFVCVVDGFAAIVLVPV